MLLCVFVILLRIMIVIAGMIYLCKSYVCIRGLGGVGFALLPARAAATASLWPSLA